MLNQSSYCNSLKNLVVNNPVTSALIIGAISGGTAFGITYAITKQLALPVIVSVFVGTGCGIPFSTFYFNPCRDYEDNQSSQLPPLLPGIERSNSPSFPSVNVVSPYGSCN